jgi:hypothetical protein
MLLYYFIIVATVVVVVVVVVVVALFTAVIWLFTGCLSQQLYCIFICVIKIYLYISMIPYMNK